MAKGAGHIQIRGRIGGLVYRIHRGQQWISKVKPFDREKYLHAPQYQTLRENNAEFGTNISLSSAVRATMPLNRRRNHLSDTNNRLTHTLCRLKHHDRTSGHGRRSFALTNNPTMLNGFRWDGKLGLENVIPVGFLIKYKHGVLTFTQPRIETCDLDNVPNYATHFRLTYILSAVPDFVYDEEKRGYVAANEGTLRKSVTVNSDYFALKGEVPYHEYKLRLKGKDLSNTTILASVKVTFYSKTGEHYDECFSGSATDTLAGFEAKPERRMTDGAVITAAEDGERVADMANKEEVLTVRRE